MSSSHLIDFSSAEPSLLRDLTPEQQERLAGILDRYFSSLETGVPESPESLLAANPDLAAPLELYLASCAQVHDMATRFGGELPSFAPARSPADERRIIGDFELIREIGRGGMGIVYEARQISLGRRVALKMLPFAAVLNAQQIARFKNEAQAAAQLHHPNIVPVHAIGVDRGVHYYAMQFVDGQPLDRAIEELREKLSRAAKGDCSAGSDAATTEFVVGAMVSPIAMSGEHIRSVLTIGIDAANALHAAHETGVVHRDIKPSNLLLDGDGKVWIADFGLARCQANASLTRTGEVLGSMRYMSPEQAAGRAAQVDHRTDVYSLGATLYEMLALRPAFLDDDGPALLRAIDQLDPPALRSLQPRASVDLESVLAMSMAKQPADRYGTAAEFAEDLRRVLRGQATIAKPPSRMERLTKWTRRHARVVAAAAAAGLLATAGLSIAMLLIAREKSNTEVALDEAEANHRTARKTVDELSLLAERLGAVPGAETIRGDMLASSLRYYQGFVQQSTGDDAELGAAIALTYNRIGDVYGGLGEREQSIAAHQASLTAWQKLAAEDPAQSGNLAMAYNNLAQAQHEVGRHAEARAGYQQAIRWEESFAQSDPSESDHRERLALYYANLGLLERDEHRNKEAETALRHAIELREQAPRVAPDAVRAVDRRALAAAYNNLSSLYEAKEPERAVLLIQQALDSLRAAPQGDLAARAELATTYNNLGGALAKCDRNAEAANAYDEAIAILRLLAKRSPDVVTYREDLAVTLNNQGMARWNVGEVGAAEHSFREAIEFLRPLVETQPRDPARQSRLGGIHNNLGMALEQAGRAPEAIDAYAAAVDELERAYESESHVYDYRAFLSKAYGNLGRSLRAADRYEEAMKIAWKRRALWPGEPERLFAVAEELALAHQGLSPEKADDCARKVVEALQEASAAGYSLPPDLDRRASFTSLDHNPAFLALVKR